MKASKLYKLYVKINGVMTYITASYDRDTVERSANYYHDQGYYTEVLEVFGFIY